MPVKRERGSRTGQREQEDHNIDSDAKAFDCVDHKMWKILKEMGLPDHLTSLLRNLYAGQKATVRTGHGTTELLPTWNWFQHGTGSK